MINFIVNNWMCIIGTVLVVSCVGIKAFGGDETMQYVWTFVGGLALFLAWIGFWASYFYN